MVRKNTKERLKEHFFDNPTIKMRVRQIERVCKLSLPSVIQSCKELEREKILKKEQIAGAILFSADRSSKEFLREKKQFNISRLYRCGFVDFVVDELDNPIIIVFGSYARGEDIKESDIDIYIQTPNKKELHFEKFEKMLNKKIQEIRYKQIQVITNKHLANNILNGVILNGFVEVFK